MLNIYLKRISRVAIVGRAKQCLLQGFIPRVYGGMCNTSRSVRRIGCKGLQSVITSQYLLNQLTMACFCFHPALNMEPYLKCKDAFYFSHRYNIVLAHLILEENLPLGLFNILHLSSRSVLI